MAVSPRYHHFAFRSKKYLKIRSRPRLEPGSDYHYLVRITGLEPARHRHQILSLARLPIPPYPHDLKIESKITTCRITCSANDPLLDVSYIRSYIIMDEKISGNQFQDIVTK